MARFILIDAGLLGFASSPPKSEGFAEFDAWVETMIAEGVDFLVPELCRYEVRRELIRLNSSAKLRRLDQFTNRFAFAIVTAEAWERAADFWAIVLQAGRPTASPDALDADAILAGVAATISRPGDQVVIATTNVRHLSWFPGIDARRWVDIL